MCTAFVQGLCTIAVLIGSLVNGTRKSVGGQRSCSQRLKAVVNKTLAVPQVACHNQGHSSSSFILNSSS